MGFVVPSLFGAEVTAAVGATYWRLCQSTRAKQHVGDL